MIHWKFYCDLIFLVMDISTPQQVQALIDKVVILCKDLPSSIRAAVTRDKISMVMSGLEGESAWQTFNKRFDILFAEDCHNKDGRLHYI